MKLYHRPCLSLSSILCMCFRLLRETFPKFNGETIECRYPVADRHGPLLGNVVHGQVDHFVDRLIRGKNAMIARHFA